MAKKVIARRGPLAIHGTPVLTGRVGVAYAGFTVSASGGAVPYTYSVQAGPLPDSLSLNSSTGLVWGTPNAEGSFAGIVIRVTDNAGQTADLPSFTIAVAAAFALYDAMAFVGKPDLSSFGIERNRIFYSAELWIGGLDRTNPDEPSIRAAADTALDENVTAAVPIQLDIEHWATDTRTNTTGTVDASVAKLVQAIAWFKDQAPTLDVGYYSIVPIRDYWSPVNQLPDPIAAWRAANDYLAPIASSADTLYPSLYTFYADPAHWVVYAQANIAEAQRVGAGKRVLPFIWPVYHDGAAQPPELRGTYIDYDYWTLQLTTIKAAACAGAVLWGYQKAWDDTQAWWQATKDFLAGL
jgi:hypothetical protein